MPNFMLTFVIHGRKFDTDAVVLGVGDDPLDVEQQGIIQVQNLKRTLGSRHGIARELGIE